MEKSREKIQERKEHLSPSRLNMYFRCGQQYLLRYIQGKIIPPGVALIRGGSVHKAAAHNFTQKIESEQDLPVADLKEAAIAEFDGRLAGGYMLTPEEKSTGARKVIGEAKDSTVRLVDVFAEKVAPPIQPELVEKKIRIPLGEKAPDLLGILDVATKDRRVIDLKTSSRRKPESDAHTSDQLTFYSMLYTYLKGTPPEAVTMEVVIDRKGTADHQRILTMRTEKDIKILLNRINSAIAGIENEIFLPAAPGHWCCSDRFCGYWHTCPYVNSERLAAAEKMKP